MESERRRNAPAFRVSPALGCLISTGVFASLLTGFSGTSLPGGNLAASCFKRVHEKGQALVA